jgi:hypothetical protein
MQSVPITTNVSSNPARRLFQAFESFDYEVPDEGYSRLSNLLTEVPDEGYSRLSNLLTMRYLMKVIPGFRIF